MPNDEIINVGFVAQWLDEAFSSVQRDFQNMMNTDFVTLQMWYDPQSLPAVGRKVESSASKALKKMAKEMNSKIIKRTPIRTGLARSSWTGSIGQPDTTFLPKDKPYPNGNAPQTYGRNALIRCNRTAENLKNGDKYFLTNNQKYVAYLEYGRSGQAPSGWIRITMIEMQDKYPEAFRTVFQGSENLEGAMEFAEEG